MEIVEAPLQIRPGFDVRYWKEIVLPCDGHIRKMIDMFLELEKAYKIEWAIAGGCLSDTYMGIPYKDIDIFISGEDAERLIASFDLFDIPDMKAKNRVSLQTKTNYSVWNNHLSLLRLEYNGVRTDIVQCRTLNRIHDFDLTMRKFIYYKGKMYADPKALEDIKQKKLSVNVPTTPYFTMHRLLDFQTRYGFQIEPSSIELLKKMHVIYYGYVQSSGYTKDVMKVYWDGKNVSTSNQQVARELLSKAVTERKQYKSHFLVEQYMRNFIQEQGLVPNIGQDEYYMKTPVRDGNVSSYIELLQKYDREMIDFREEKLFFPFPTDLYKKIEKELYGVLEPFLQKIRLPLLFEPFEPWHDHSMVERLRKNINHVIQTKSFSGFTEEQKDREFFSDVFIYDMFPGMISKIVGDDILKEEEFFKKIYVLSKLFAKKGISYRVAQDFVRSCVPVQLEEKNVTVRFFTGIHENIRNGISFSTEINCVGEYVVTKDKIYRSFSQVIGTELDHCIQSLFEEKIKSIVKN